MRCHLVQCEGFETAMLAAMLSFGKTSFDDFTTDQIRPEIKERFKPLSEQMVLAGAGHDKFLESIQYWIIVQAPLYMWKQIDTYRHATKLSESTMHRSWKNGLTPDMFSQIVYHETLERLNANIREYQSTLTTTERKKTLFGLIVGNLPDSYLQTRMICLNAKTLRNMYLQRKDHKLEEWRDFCRWLKTLPHGDLISLERKEIETTEDRQRAHSEITRLKSENKKLRHEIYTLKSAVRKHKRERKIDG